MRSIADRTCPKCGGSKPCKPCKAKYDAERYAKRKPYIRAQQTRYYLTNGEVLRERRAKTRAQRVVLPAPRALPPMEWPKWSPTTQERIEWDLPKVDHDAAHERAIAWADEPKGPKR